MNLCREERRQRFPAYDCRKRAATDHGGDVDRLIGAGRYERGEARQTWRNGYRDRSLDIRLGTLNLKIPKMRRIPPPKAVCPDLLIGVKSMAYVMRYNHFPD